MKILFKFFERFLLMTLVVGSVLIAGLATGSNAWAGNVNSGARVFSANCTACHMGGRNVIVASKTLQKSALQKYLKDFAENAELAITYQITNGRNVMPAFKGRLSPKQIDDVAAYVTQQAEVGW
ncbi:MAG: c-type cytochrome [Microcoleaceae cyanobacterium]